MASPEHHLFFASRIENGVAYLDRDEARHAMSVLRFSPGDALRVTDGNGSVYECAIRPGGLSDDGASVVSVAKAPKPRCEVRLFIGLCDRDKFEESAENCAALGAGRIAPLVCRFCQKPWWKEWDKHEGRIRKKLVSGITQSLNPWLPQLAKPATVPEALSESAASFIIAAEAGGEIVSKSENKVQQATSVSCFVGPPGGFSPEEIDALRNAGAVFVSLSANRLRTELAAALLCGMVRSFASAS
jgi:16S rRNA (uracil1498-N3)-methyltransferase